jgi:hypothetical protein
VLAACNERDEYEVLVDVPEDAKPRRVKCDVEKLAKECIARRNQQACQ